MYIESIFRYIKAVRQSQKYCWLAWRQGWAPSWPTVGIGSWQLGIRALSSHRSHESWTDLVEYCGLVLRRLFLSSRGYRVLEKSSFFIFLSWDFISARSLYLQFLPTQSYAMSSTRYQLGTDKLWWFYKGGARCFSLHYEGG